MSRIVIIAPGTLPIPAVKGGAVETGIDQLINENELHKDNIFEVYSCWDKDAEEKTKFIEKSKFKFYKFGILDKIEMIIIKSINKVFSLLNIKKSFNIYPRFTRFICQDIKNIKADVILLKNSVKFVNPIKKVTDIPIVLQLHNDFLNSNTPDCNTIAANCYKIVANSKYIKKRICSIESISPSKVFINMNCLDKSSFIQPSINEKKDIIKRFNIDENKKNIIFVGRIARVKGIKELLLALQKIENNKNWHLLIAGGKWFSSNYKDRYYKELTKISEKFKNRITFLGYVKHEEIKNLYSVSSIAVVPSIWEEPAGRVVLEAEAMGIPVVASNSGGIPEYLGTDSGLIVNKDKFFIKNLSKSIEELIENPQRADEMGKRGIEYAKMFTTKRYYEEILSIIRSEKISDK